MSQSGEKKWSILKQSEHIQFGCTQELTDTQADEKLGFQKVLLKRADFAGKAFQALANWISCGVFCGS